LSVNALDFCVYHDKTSAITWRKSSIRNWLNDTKHGFLSIAFTDEEQGRIALATVPAHKNPEYSSDSGLDTRDKVFLLSLKEAKQYFPSDKERQCQMSPYIATKKGAKAVDASCSWWLRSPGVGPEFAAVVQDDGSINYVGSVVSLVNIIGVRPALWLNL
ncbi:MAG: hypothetical protein J5855_09790, partial [Mailhella sp.]|nr:hypothetical protein [Mailhella sp.]